MVRRAELLCGNYARRIVRGITPFACPIGKSKIQAGGRTERPCPVYITHPFSPGWNLLRPSLIALLRSPVAARHCITLDFDICLFRQANHACKSVRHFTR